MTRNQIHDLMIAALEADDVESAEVWQDILDRMDLTAAEIWLS